MKFQIGDKVRMIGNDINTHADTGLRRGMDGVIKRTDGTPWKESPYEVKWPCGNIWVREYQIKLIKS